MNWSQIRRDITGPSLFYAPSYLFVLPVFWLTSLLSTAHLSDFKNLLLWSLANILSMALCWAIISLADRFIFRRRKESWLIPVLLFSAFIGATKGGTTTIFGAIFGVEDNFGDLIGGRMVQTSLLGLFTVPALAILAATRSKFQEVRDTLVAERVRLAANDPILNSTATEGYARLAKEIGYLRDGIQTSGNAQVSNLIRDIVQNGLRPITHRLWDKEDQRQTNFTLRDLSRVAIVGHPYVAWPVALILFLGTLGPYVASAGWAEGLARSTITAFAIALTYRFAKLLRTEKAPLAWLYYVSIHLLLAGFIVGVSKELFGALPGFTAISAFFVLFIWILQTGYMTSFVAGALATHNEMREQLQALSKKLGIERQVMQARAQLAKRDIANYLHSELQNKLLAIALRIESGDSNVDGVLEELTAVQGLLTAGVQADPLDSRPLAIQLAELVDRWKGFVKIYLESDSRITNQQVTRQVLLVVTEGLSNSVRHGLASEVSISIKSIVDGVLIEISDDGIGPRSGLPGLGSRFFESVSCSNWSLSQRQEGGSKLTLEL